MKIFVLAFGVLAVLSAVNAAPGLRLDEDGPQCKSNNGDEGLEEIINEFVNLLPKDKLISIYITAVSSDPEVQEAMEYLQSDEFKNIIIAIQNAPNFYKLLNYACEKLYYDAYYHYNAIAEIIGLPTITRPPFTVFKSFATVYARSGLLGMLNDMLDVIPVEKIKELFKDKLENDKYVKITMELMASNDVKNIVKLVENLKEFNELLDKLRGWNINADQVVAAVKKFFKWD